MLTPTALHEYDQRVNVHATHLESRVAALNADNGFVNVTQLFHWFSVDVMGDLTFSKSFRMLENGEAHPIAGLLNDSLDIVGVLSPVPWLMRIGLNLLPGHPGRGITASSRELSFENLSLVLTGLQKSGEICDISNWLINHNKGYEPSDEDLRWLYGDSTSAIIAGSDTVSGTLVYVFYEIAASQKDQLKLAEELLDIDVFDRQVLRSLPHLNGVINEVLRLHPPIPTHASRKAPPEGVTIAGQFVPGGTTLVAPKYTIARLQSYFEKPNEFIPERWYSAPQMVKDRRAFMPFNQGQLFLPSKSLGVCASLELKS
ncbi:MAG: hypothetical protein Q9216_004217 [Gyalolechia sp. 2 TL-2023]